jgi:two-component system, chemotaxis family, chemotaxis protein CheY
MSVNPRGVTRDANYFEITALAIMNKAQDRGQSSARRKSDSASVPHRVLVVDDDVDAAEALVDILEHSGYEAAAVHDGIQALKHLTSGGLPPDVMILDLFMPRMNGWDLMQELKRTVELAKIPVIVVSAFAYNAGILADAVLSKPLDMDALLRIMPTLVTRDQRGN